MSQQELNRLIQSLDQMSQRFGAIEHTLYELTVILRKKPKLRMAVIFTKSIALSTTETLTKTLDFEGKIIDISGWSDSALVKVRILDPKVSILERGSRVAAGVETAEDQFPLTTQQFHFTPLHQTWERNKAIAVEFQNTDASNAHIPVIVIIVEKVD